MEVEATLDACLQIHRWDRATAVLAQLRVIYQGNTQQLQRVYNKVLEAMVFDHIWNRSSDNVSTINSWVEKTMSRAGVPPNAQTYALKIKAAISTLQGRQRDRTVRRYWEMAKERSVDGEVASLREILSDNDLGKLSEISPLEADMEWVEDEAEENNIAVQGDVVAQRALPAVRETDQKGLGMVSLKQSLSLFSDLSHLNGWESLKDTDHETREAYARQRQMQLEEDSLSSAMDRWRQENDKLLKMGIAGTMSGGKIGPMMWKWHQQLAESIAAELDKVSLAEESVKKTEEEKLRTEYGPFLRLIAPQKLAALTVLSVLSIMTKTGTENSIKLARLVTELGRTVELEVQAEMVKQRKALKEAKARLMKKAELDPTHQSPALPRKDAESHEASLSQRVHWSIAIHAKLGSILCELMFDTAKIGIKRKSPTDATERTYKEAAFNRKTVFHNGKRLGVVSMHQELAETLAQEPVADAIAKQLPMVCKPAPWTGFRQGGYLNAQNEVLRIKYVDQAQKEYTNAAAERGDLDELFEGLNVLGQTGWRINKDVFAVMLEAWNSGEAIANLPPLEKAFPDVPKPLESATAREKYEYYQKMQALNNERSGLHSNRCFQNFQMEIAKAYLEETFYFPHNVDFRGRAYPIPPYLNQMGADNARGLLLFADGRELGGQGLRWLKVHLANVCGYDKASLTDRAAFADKHMHDVRDSVQNPLNGSRWWLKAEDPWQCLATCHELVKAIDSGLPEKFVSHLPIHQDGTCNGLQHYAALGGDIAGARQVNLEPGDKPADVYTGVCELVKADIRKDAEAGNELAKLLDGRVTRKIVKQTVMTNVYGVTFNGAMHQVRKQVDALLPDVSEQKRGTAASMYIARKIFKGLGTLFEGAHDIQYWFGDCANRITNSISPAQLEEAAAFKSTKPKSRSSRKALMAERKAIDQSDFRSTIVWTTPLKLPVVQPYRIQKSNLIKTHMANITLAEPSITDSVDKRKQLQGFPPNFIHSLDATHMMLSAMKAKEHGLTFSAVHDSFWTHAADIDTLNTLLRDAFIRMHAEDIVGRLAAEFRMRYKGHLYLARVAQNSSIAQEIATYRQSIPMKELEGAGMRGKFRTKQLDVQKRRQFYELMQEYERQKLLASEDPKEREKGEKMVTAAKIFEKHNGEQYLASKNSLGETALGKVPGTQVDPKVDVVEEALQHGEEAEVQDVDLSSTLEPLIEKERTFEGRVEVSPDEATEKTVAKTPKQTRKAVGTNNSVWVWLPLTFKPVPKKGDWDVRRLRDSVYFFS